MYENILFCRVCSDINDDCTNETQAQTLRTNLEQIELMKQFLETWQCEFGKDTVVIFETKAYCNGAMEMLSKWICKNKIMFE